MKTKNLVLTTVAALLLGYGNAQANIVGYVNTPFQPGANWFGNPLLNTNNLLSTLIPSAPDGTTVSFWN